MNADRRNQLILAVLGTIAAVGILYTSLISRFQVQIAKATSDAAGLETKLNEERKQQNKLSEDRSDFERWSNLLVDWEGTLPTDDPYAYLGARLPAIAAANGIHELAVDPPTPNPGAVVGMSKAVNYPGFRVALRGMASYAQIGNFLADLENRMLFAQVTDLRLVVGGVSSADSQPPLRFSLTLEGVAHPDVRFQ